MCLYATAILIGPSQIKLGYEKFISESINLNKKIGTFIDNNIILSAQSVGSLFIRKCYDNSLIHLYTNILKECKYNNSVSGDSIPIQKRAPMNYDISTYNKYLIYKKEKIDQYNLDMNLEDKYFKKYLLYKNKYLKLSEQ
jgi:hypothetical protein